MTGRRKTPREESGLSSFFQYIRNCACVCVCVCDCFSDEIKLLKKRNLVSAITKLDTVFAKQLVTERNDGLQNIQLFKSKSYLSV